MKYTLLLTAILLSAYTRAQVPQITDVSRRSGPTGAVITIKGTGFSQNKNDMTVSFGGAKGTIRTSTEFLMEVNVPPGTIFDYLAVTNLVSGLTGFSSDKFLLSFSGTGFDPAKFSLTSQLPGGSNLFDLAVGDLDGDGLNDIITTNNVDGAASATISIFQNVTASNTLVPGFSKIWDNDLITGTAIRNITTGDVNGDGKADIIAAKGGNTADRIFIFKNVSTPGFINFERPVTVLISVSGSASSARRVRVMDLDKNGKPEIILTDQNLAKVHIFQNRSTKTNIVFPVTEKVVIDAPSGQPTLGLETVDLNLDGKPEIVFSSNLGPNLYVVPNQSTPGTVSMGSPQSYSLPGQLVNLTTADLDGDGDAEIAATDFQSGKLFVLNNTSSAGNISFSSPLVIQTGLALWGISAGDINGDGKTDLVLASRNSGQKAMAVINETTGSGWGYALHAIGNDASQINLSTADLNGDGKPDLAYVTDANTLEIIRNQHCLIPKVTPLNPEPICSNQPVKLFATAAPKARYVWKDAFGTEVGTDVNPVEITAAGIYSVDVIVADDGCSVKSNAVEVKTGGSNIPLKPNLSDPGVICEGNTLTLHVDSIPSYSYVWKYPDGSLHGNSTHTIPDVDADNAGRYSVVAILPDGCRSDPSTTIVQVNKPPEIEVVTVDGPYFCQGLTKRLEANDIPGATYNWRVNGQPLAQTAVPHYDASIEGLYSVMVEDSYGCTATSGEVPTTMLQVPHSSFTSDNGSCTGQAIQFTNNSTYDNRVTVFYEWDFGDNTITDVKDPQHAYNSNGSYTVSLKVYYDNEICSDISGKTLSIDEMVDLTMSVNGREIQGSTYNLCSGTTATLSVNANPGDVLWSTGSTQPEITVQTAGTYKVTSGTGTGCENSNELTVSEVPLPNVTATADEQVIQPGQSTRLHAGGAQTYNWEPGESLDNPGSPDPVASPVINTDYTVTGIDPNGCSGTAMVTVRVEEIPLLEVRAAPVFTPNGDMINDIWVIQNIDDFKNCAIKIFNRQGLTMYEASTYNNDWDGTYKGTEAPEGAYYYVLSCDNGQRYTGHFTLLR